MSGRGGRPKGDGVKHNKATPLLDVEETTDSEVPELYQDEKVKSEIENMLKSNLGNLAKWLEKVGEKNPKGALDIFRDFAEYILPKQQRTDNKGDVDGKIVINIIPSSQRTKEQNRQKNVIDEILGN